MQLTEQQVEKLVMQSFVKGILAERMGLVSAEIQGVHPLDIAVICTIMEFLEKFEEWACKMTGQW